MDANLNIVRDVPPSPVIRQGTALTSLTPLNANFNPADAALNEDRYQLAVGYARPTPWGTWDTLVSLSHAHIDDIRAFLHPDLSGAADTQNQNRKIIDDYFDTHLAGKLFADTTLIVGTDLLYGYGRQPTANGNSAYTVPLNGSGALVGVVVHVGLASAEVELRPRGRSLPPHPDGGGERLGVPAAEQESVDARADGFAEVPDVTGDERSTSGEGLHAATGTPASYHSEGRIMKRAAATSARTVSWSAHPLNSIGGMTGSALFDVVVERALAEDHQFGRVGHRFPGLEQDLHSLDGLEAAEIEGVIRSFCSDARILHRVGSYRNAAGRDPFPGEAVLQHGRGGEPAVHVSLEGAEAPVHGEAGGESRRGEQAVVIAPVDHAGSLHLPPHTELAKLPAPVQIGLHARVAEAVGSSTRSAAPRRAATRNTSGETSGNGVCTCTTSGSNAANVHWSSAPTERFQIESRPDRSREAGARSRKLSTMNWSTW